jgi:uncharacterized protein (TIGR02453 family)
VAFDEELAERTREFLASRPGYSEKKMFGGLCFLINGNMCCGINGEDLMLRVGADRYHEALSTPGARPMDFTGRALKGMVYVGPEHLKSTGALVRRVDIAVGFVETLPVKQPKARPVRASASTRAAPVFAGFSATTMDFLRELAANNDKTWFDAHRSDYESAFVTPAENFVRALAPRLQTLSRSICCQPRINGSIFRLQRDQRFVTNNPPYKPHMDFTFWDGPDRGFGTPSLFLRITPDHLLIGGGVHDFGRAIQRYRAAVDDGRQGRGLAKVLAGLTGGYRVNEPALKRVPRDFDADHPRADLLRHKGLTVTLQQHLPAELNNHQFVDWCVTHYSAFRPLHRWLLRAVAIREAESFS